MLYSLTGVLKKRTLNAVYISSGGMTFVVEATPTLCANVREGQAVEVFTQLLLPADGGTPVLYGFNSDAERHLFTLLRKVNGIGARIAAAIVGTLGIDGVISAVVGEEARAFSGVSGVGTKLARRLLLDIDKEALVLLGSMGPSKGGGAPSHSPAISEAITALTNLGFTIEEARETVGMAVKTGSSADDVNELLATALKLRGQSS